MALPRIEEGVMSATNLPPVPTYREISLALASSSPRVREAALSVRPPDQMDPREIQIVLDAVRERDAQVRGGVDIKA
jgi:hypothetical protein